LLCLEQSGKLEEAEKALKEDMRVYEKSIIKKVDYKKCFVSVMRKSIHDFIDMIFDVEKNRVGVQTPRMGIVIPVTENWEVSGETSEKLINQCFEKGKEFLENSDVSAKELAEGKIDIVDTSKSKSTTIIFASAPLWKISKDKIRSSYKMEALIEEIVKSSVEKDLGRKIELTFRYYFDSRDFRSKFIPLR
jgi:hypothetical protein